MRLSNSTCYSTRDLKKIFTRIANQELDPEKAKRVYFDIVYSKGSHSGYATVGGTRSTIRLPKPPFKLDHAQVALVIAHEMAHLRGLHHGASFHCARYSWTHGDYKTFYAWAHEYPISVRVPKPKAIVAPADAKLTHARMMLAKNEAKLKRTAVLVKKWTAKVKYYQKRAEIPKTIAAAS